MEFRYNEIIIWLIPGLYFLCLSCLFVLLPFTDSDEITNTIVSLKDIPEGILTSAALFFIPFVSFVIGYLINYVASQTEFWMYEFNGLNRPSKIILSDKTERYKLADLNKLLHNLGAPLSGNFTNKESNTLFVRAKQCIDLSPLDTYYFKSVFGRNIFCAQIMVILGVIYECIYFCYFDVSGIIINTTIGFLLFTSWRRNNLIYVKNIFSLYLRSITE